MDKFSNKSVINWLACKCIQIKRRIKHKWNLKAGQYNWKAGGANQVDVEHNTTLIKLADTERFLWKWRVESEYE